MQANGHFGHSPEKQDGDQMALFKKLIPLPGPWFLANFCFTPKMSDSWQSPESGLCGPWCVYSCFTRPKMESTESPVFATSSFVIMKRWWSNNIGAWPPETGGKDARVERRASSVSRPRPKEVSKTPHSSCAGGDGGSKTNFM
jgi:hypothetical protein